MVIINRMYYKKLHNGKIVLIVEEGVPIELAEVDGIPDIVDSISSILNKLKGKRLIM